MDQKSTNQNQSKESQETTPIKNPKTENLKKAKTRAKNRKHLNPKGDVKKALTEVSKIKSAGKEFKYELFVDSYINNRFQAQAAFKEVYGHTNNLRHNAYEMMKKPEVQVILKAKMSELRAETMISKIDLITELEEVKSICRETPNGSMVKNWINAIELQAKMLGMFEENKVNVALINTAKIDFGLNFDSSGVDDIEIEDAD